MTKNELVAALRLQRIPYIGDITAKKLIAHCGSPTAVFKDKMQHLLRIEGIGRHMLQELYKREHQLAAEREFEFIEANKLEYVYFTDNDYPGYLKHCIDGPILLFIRGHIDWNRRKVISVVGTRNITAYGRAFCERFIDEIAPIDPLIVSGFAYGVDICIQKAAIAAGLQTIGCLAHGLNQIYPKAHQKYCRSVEEKGGFLTEFWSDTNPDRENFLKRNRIIAGISEATVVVESAEKGGSLVTADLAAGYHRDVFAVPGRVDAKYSRGCNNLIGRQKAQLISCAADMIYFLGWDLHESVTAPVQKQLFVALDPDEETIYQYLKQHGRQFIDSIALNCKFPVHKTAAILLNMEMKGVIQPMAGKLYEAI